MSLPTRTIESEAAFRAAVRDYCDSELPVAVRSKVRANLFLEKQDYLDFLHSLIPRGSVAGHWPRAWGGCDWNPMQHFIFEEDERRRRRALADSLRHQLRRAGDLSEDMQAIEKRLALELKADPQMQRIAQMPGVGLLTATAAIATMGEASAFKSGRELRAWLGLVPKQTGTGGKIRLGGISKRGDTYLRTLLIHGARSVLAHVKEPVPWLEGLKARRPVNLVIVAQAAKMASTIWAVTAKEQSCQRGFQSVRPLAA